MGCELARPSVSDTGCPARFSLSSDSIFVAPLQYALLDCEKCPSSYPTSVGDGTPTTRSCRNSTLSEGAFLLLKAATPFRMQAQARLYEQAPGESFQLGPSRAGFVVGGQGLLLRAKWRLDAHPSTGNGMTMRRTSPREIPPWQAVPVLRSQLAQLRLRIPTWM